MRSDWRLLAVLLRPHAGLLALAAALSIAASALELMPYWLLVELALAIAGPSASLATLAGLTGAILLAAVLRLLVFGGANIASHTASFRVQRQLREHLLDTLHRAPLARVQGHAGDLKKTVIDDVGSLDGLIGHTLPDAVAGIAVPLIAAGWLLAIDWRMALASLALLPIAIWAYRRSFRNLDELLMRWHAADTAANTALLSHVRGMATLKAHHRVASSIAGLRQAVHALATLAESVTRQTAVPYALFFVALSTNLMAVLPLGILLNARGSLAPADLLLFVTLGAGLTAPLLRVLSAFGAMQRQLLGVRRIGALLALPGLAEPPAPAAPPDHAIRLRGVCGGPADGPDTLHDLWLDIPGQGYTAIVGASGAGKSSLLGLLTGAMELRAGHATLGGIPLASIPSATRAAWIACVFQETLVFAGTLRENLLIANPQASATDVAAAVRQAGLSALLACLPDGLDTHVAERGASLSGGERQRVAIARALLANAPVLLLDEATSAADPQTELGIQRDLRRLAGRHNVIAVTHRLAHARLADRIVVLDQGRIEAVGPHEQLLASCSTYQRLWEAQGRGHAWTLSRPTFPATAS